MPATIKPITREFKYGDLTLPDLNPNMTPEEVLEFYTNQYPELNNYSIDKEELIGNKQTFSTKKTLGTKG